MDHRSLKFHGVHALHDTGTREQLERHPVVGPSWEWLGIRTVARRLGARRDQCWYWATRQGAELDLLVVAGGRRLGFEFKRTTAPKLTPSMRIALSDLRLDRLDVVYSGTRAFPMAERVRAVPLRAGLDLVPPLDAEG